MKIWILMCVAIGLMQTAAALAEDEKTAKVKDGDIKRLIDQLDSDVFAEREAAVVKLTKLGRPAIEALMAAAPGTRFSKCEMGDTMLNARAYTSQ